MLGKSNISQGSSEKEEVPATLSTGSNSEARNSGYQEHSFLVNQTYFEDMEERVLKLLDTFKRGELTAFDENYSLDKLKEVKERQEKLAQMHFELENEDLNKAAGSEEEKAKRTQEKMDKLMTKMESLCSSVQSLHQHPEGD